MNDRTAATKTSIKFERTTLDELEAGDVFATEDPSTAGYFGIDFWTFEKIAHDTRLDETFVFASGTTFGLDDDEDGFDSTKPVWKETRV